MTATDTIHGPRCSMLAAARGTVAAIAIAIGVIAIGCCDAGSAEGQDPNPAKQTFEPQSARPRFILEDLKLPAGPGRDETEAYCGACHSMRLVVQQRQTREGWQSLFAYMVEEHAMEPLPLDDHRRVLDYLTKHFGLRPGTRRLVQ